MAHDKESSLEVVIADLFEKSGYTVIHNGRKKGKSGVEHQIDVWAEYSAPLHTSRVILEVKSHQEQIDKATIMKFIQMVEDLDVDKGIFVTTNDFTPNALMAAEQHNNIELWNLDKVAKLVDPFQVSSSEKRIVEKTKTETKIVAPRMSFQQVEQYAKEKIKKKAQGGLFGAGKVKEKLQRIQLILYPYYELAIRAAVTDVKKTGLISREEIQKILPCKVSLDAVTGELVEVTNESLSYKYAYLSLLTDEEAKLLRSVRGKKDFDARALMALAYDKSKAIGIINGLIGKGVIDISQSMRIPDYYIVRVEYPHDPSKLNSLSGLFPVNNYTEQDGKVIEPRIEPALVSKAVKNYWEAVEVDDITIVYYPFYEIWYEREDGSNRLEAMDGISGSLNEHVTRKLTR